MMARLAAAFLFIVVIAGVAGFGGYLWFTRAVMLPGPLEAPQTVIIAPGTGLGGVSRQLRAAGIIDHAWLFELEARRSGQARALKPGEYQFNAGASIVQALDKIVRHDVVIRFVTVPEGLVSADIARILADAPGLMGDAGAPVPEGSLLPETYRYEWGDSRAALVARMRAARDQALATLWAARAPDLPLRSPEEAMILAAIVEKETGLDTERARVAGVFINRLRRGMKLQSDPTVIYGLAPQTGELPRALTRADLETPNAFNTYAIDGLPPSPICHPGRESIAAVLQPAQSNELYFVADGSGGHAFAATLQEHNRNVARWRQLQRGAPADAR